MATIKIGKLALEIPEATLGVVEDVARIEDEAKAAATAKDHDGLRDAYLRILVALAASPDVTEKDLRRALPFRRQLEAAQTAYRDALVAAGIIDATAGGSPGEAVSP